MIDYTPWIKLYLLKGQFGVKFGNTPLWGEFFIHKFKWEDLEQKGYCFGSKSKSGCYDFTQKFIDEVVNVVS